MSSERRITRVVFACDTPLGLKIGTNKLGLTIVVGFHSLAAPVEEGNQVDGPGAVCCCINKADVLIRVNEDSCYGLDHEAVKKRVTLLKGSLKRSDGTIYLTFASPAEAQIGMNESDEKAAETAANAPVVDAQSLYVAYLEGLCADRHQNVTRKSKSKSKSKTPTTSKSSIITSAASTKPPLTPPPSTLPTPTLTSSTQSSPSLPSTPTVPKSPPKSMLEQCHAALNGNENDIVDIQALSTLIFHNGVPEEIGLRSTIWRLFLGYLPVQRKEWKATVQLKRELYFQWCEDLYPKDAHERRSVGDQLKSKQNPTATTVLQPKDKIETKTEDTEKTNKTDKADKTDKTEKTEKTEKMEKIDKADKADKAEKAEIDPLSPSLDQEWTNRWSESALLSEIWKDVKRTHNSYSFFSRERDPTIADTLERILFIYAQLNRGVRYVQGMNEVLAPILFCFFKDRVATKTTKKINKDDDEDDEKEKDDELNLGYSNLKNVEADVFFCFQTIMSHMHHLFITGLDDSNQGLDGTLNQMMNDITEQNSSLATHLIEKLQLDPKFYGMRWITTLLAREFDMPDCLRLWDSLFADLFKTQSFDFLIVLCACIVTSQQDLLMTGDFATAITALQQQYSVMDINALIRISIERNDDKNNPNKSARKIYKSSGSFRRDVVAANLKNVAGVMEAKAANLFGRVKSWASEKKKKSEVIEKNGSGKNGGNKGSGNGSSVSFNGSAKSDVSFKSSLPERGSLMDLTTSNSPKVVGKKKVESPKFVEKKSIFGENSGGGLFDESGSSGEEGGEGLFD